MNPRLHRVRFVLHLLVLALWGGPVAAQDQLVIDRETSGTRMLPLALEGLTGECLSVLRFDLEIAGFDLTTTEQAQYVVGGNQSASLQGRLTDRISKAPVLERVYSGGSVRAQAHAFADDIVEKLTGRKGIARTRIAFRAEANRNSEIYLADYDGHAPLALTQDQTISRDPAWAPGRRMLYYTSYKSGNPCVYSHDLQDGSRRVIAAYPGLNTGATVSPDGRRLALILSRSGSPDVYVADADGGNLRQLTFTKEDESSPCWSPDGRTLCFTSRVSGRAALYLLPAEGGSMRRLEATGAINTTEPDWSPDGKFIAFTEQRGGFQISIVPAGGGSAAVLTTGEDPSWAPNSRTIVFTRRVGGRRVLSLLDVPTKRVKDTRQVSGSCSQPVWAK
jgi:TolB protein